MSKRTKFQVRSDAANQRWHVRDDQKEGFWREHLLQWQKSGKSKRAYCIDNELAYSSFMAWRREIELRDREKIPPLHVAALLPGGPQLSGSPFVPIRIVEEACSEQAHSTEQPQPIIEPQQIEISLPTGAVIRLRDSCDPAFVAKLLGCLKS